MDRKGKIRLAIVAAVMGLGLLASGLYLSKFS
jgi:hypothetical protein